jgi:hypothetical protein
MKNMRQLLEEDCTTLLERALIGKTVCAFGEDGNGQYGRNDIAQWFTISRVKVDVVCDDNDDPILIFAAVAITLDGYHADTFGHIATDKNFEISLQKHLSAHHIEPNTLVWPMPISAQGPHSVTMDIDIPRLLAWS